MATLATRLTNTGTYLVNGTFDEVTQTKVSVTTDTVYASSFDEVTYNSTAPVIKNLFTYSEQFDSLDWSLANTSVSANAAIAPDGKATADKLNLTVTTGTFYLNQNKSLSSGTVYTQSIYAKAAEQTIIQMAPSTGFSYGINYANYDLVNGTILKVGSDPASIAYVGNGWYRCSYTQAAIVEGSGSRIIIVLTGGNPGRLPTFTGTANSGIYIWGAQLEASSTATIYQPVAAANTLVSTGMIHRADASGNVYITGIFDEVSGIT